MGNHQILCVDDEPEMLELMARILNSSGFQCIGAKDGVEAIDRAIAVIPKLILLDLTMPRMDGWDAFQGLKANKLTCDIPIIIVTAKAQSIDRVLGKKSIAGYDSYITKPFAPNELLKGITDVLNDRRLGIYEDDS